MPLSKLKISTVNHTCSLRAKLKTVSVVVFVLLVCTSCIKERGVFKLNDQVDISYKNRASIKLPDTTFVIRFTDFVEESRCPPFTTCISEGKAIVNLELNFSESKKLGMGHKSMLEMENIYDTVSIGNYNLRLLGIYYTGDAYFNIVEKSFISIKIESKE